MVLRIQLFEQSENTASSREADKLLIWNVVDFHQSQELLEQSWWSVITNIDSPAALSRNVKTVFIDCWIYCRLYPKLCKFEANIP